MQHHTISGRQSNARRDGRESASILLYGLGLALTLSLVFNGFLLHEQSRNQQVSYDYGLSKSDHSANLIVWQQQLSDCARSNEQKDSLIHRLEHPPNAPPNQSAIVRRTSSD